MAPQGSGYSSVDDNDSGSSVWLASYQIFGWQFTNGYAVANIVFVGIWMVALCVIAIWIMGVERRSEASRSVLWWMKYGVAMSLNLIFYTFVFAQDIIQTSGASVAGVYFLLANIFYDALYPATTWLLFTIYSLLFYCCVILDETKRARHRGFIKAHFIFCLLMIGLWIALLSFDIVNTSISINSSSFDPNNLYSAWPAQIVYDLDVAFQAALLAASLEILLFAIGLLVKARRRGKEYYMANLCFFGLVAIPFFILRVFYLAFAAIFELSYSFSETWGTYLAFDIITGACTVVIFVGIALVSRLLEQIQLRPWNGNQFANQPPNAYSPAPAGHTFSQHSYGPVSPASAAQTYPQELHNHVQGVPEMPVYHMRHERP